MLRLSLLFECFVFVFGFARSNVGVSSCFRVICYLFLVVRAIVLLLWRFLLLLLVYEFFIQHLLPFCCALGFNIRTMFMFHHVIYMGLVQLQLVLHRKCSCIVITFALSIFLHHKCSYVIDSFASQMFLHRNCSCNAIACALLIILQHGIKFFFSAICVVSNFCVFFFFAGFWVLWLQPHKNRKCNCVL